MRSLVLVFAAVFGMIMLAFMPPVRAETDLLNTLSERLAKNSRLCANFQQSKVLQALSRPLVSTGRMIFISDKGVLWQVLAPFPAKVLIKETEMVQWNADGDPVHLNSSRSSLLQGLTHVFFSLFTGDLTKLKESFEISSSTIGEEWHLDLKPRESSLAKIITRIEATGAGFVNAIVVTEAGKDTTSIAFTDIDNDRCEPSEAEHASFEH